jgi:hypothetical protein
MGDSSLERRPRLQSAAQRWYLIGIQAPRRELLERVIMGLWPTLGNENRPESPLYNLRSVER